jgi:hypothetical protein
VNRDLQPALVEAIDFLEKGGHRYAVIGGVAVAAWGFIRATRDVDIKVLVPDTDYPGVRATLRAAFPERGRPDRPPAPLLVDAKIAGITVDFLLAIPGYDESVVHHAVRSNLDDLSVWLCTAEDLIIQKAVAGRGRDWQDIEGILIEQRGQLDLQYVEDWLTQFAELLERPEILTQYQEIQAHIAEAVAELNGE